MIYHIFPIRWSLPLDLLANCSFGYIFLQLILHSHPIESKFSTPHMSDRILDGPPLNYGISWKLLHLLAIWLHNLHPEPFIPLFSRLLSRCPQHLENRSRTRPYKRCAKLSHPWSNTAQMDLLSSNLRGRPLWVHRLRHSGLPGCVQFENGFPRAGPPSDQFGHSRIWKVDKVLMVRSDCKKFVLQVGRKTLDTKSMRTVLAPWPPPSRSLFGQRVRDKTQGFSLPPCSWSIAIQYNWIWSVH